MKVNIIDVLSKPTAQKPAVREAIKEVVKPVINSNDFDEEVDQIAEAATEILGNPLPVHEPDPEPPHPNPEQSADALIDMIDIAQKAIFLIIGSRKLKKKIPDELMEQFINVDLKDLRGEELTEAEKKQLERYKGFVHRLDRLASDIPFTKDEREDLKKATEAFVVKTGIVIPPSVWFFAQVGSVISKRVVTIAME